MARINGVDLPREKRVEIGLTYIFGIGRTRATKICAETGVDPSTRVKDLTEDEVTKIRDFIDANYTTEGDLRREVRQNASRAFWASGRVRGGFDAPPAPQIRSGGRRPAQKSPSCECFPKVCAEAPFV